MGSSKNKSPGRFILIGVHYNNSGSLMSFPESNGPKPMIGENRQLVTDEPFEFKK